MMRQTFRYMTIVLMLFLFSAGIRAQQVLNIHCSAGNVEPLPLLGVDSISFSADKSETYFHTATGVTVLSTTDIDSLSFGMVTDMVLIHYAGTSVSILNPFAGQGVEVSVEGADVTVISTTSDEVEYRLTGSTSDGSFKIYSDKKFILSLGGVSLTNNDGPAINIQSGKKATVNLMAGTTNTLVDGAAYTPSGGEDMKATFFSEGQLVFNGTGILQVAGNHKHAICSDDYITVNDGRFLLRGIVSDGFHANDYILISGGSLDIEAGSDAIDGDAGYIEINGGTLDIRVTGDTSKGLKCDSTITINGGEIRLITSGNAVVEDGDPSYCTAIKSNRDVVIGAGTLAVTCSGTAGRGISVDGDIAISGGSVNISTTGNGSTYTNTSNQKDSYAAACIKADGNIVILDGTLTLGSSGTAGKCISAGGTLTIGDDTHSPVITARTSGRQFAVSGSGMNADYANPKAIKSEGNLTVNNGTLNISTAQDGGEGLESKAVLTIHGGTLEIETYDDCINAKSQLVINGGRLYCNASGNDGIDSNGTITFAGGLTITSGTSTPEEGVDCDQNRFAITGGILIGTGGATSIPTTSACTQRSVVYKGSSLSGKFIHIQDASGVAVFTCQIPTKSSLNSQVTVLISTDALQASTSYTLYTGGSVSGGTHFHGYYTGAIYSGGTQAATFTTSNMVTSIGTSGGGGGFPGGGGGRPR